MIKIITLANLQLFLTKCKTLFASKKHTHTAADITGLPSGGGADSTRYTVDEHGYTVIKDKYGNDAFWANGVNRELRDSKGNTAVRIKNPEGLLPNNLGGGVEINYGKNANGTVEKAIVTSDTNVQVKTPDGNTVARIEDGKTSWKTPTSTTDAIQLTPTKSHLKFNDKGLEVKKSKATLTHEKEVLLNSEAGSGASLRLSEKDVHLDGIDGGMMVESRESLSGNIYYGMNLPLKNSSTDTNPTTQPIKGILLHKTYVELTGPDNSIYGDAIYLGAENSYIGVSAEIFNFNSIYTDVQFNGYLIPSLFPNRAIPNIHSLLSQVTNAIISVPDEELTYGYMFDYSEEICVFHNESHTMYFLKDGDVIQPLSIPVFNSVEEALAVLDTDTQLLYAKNPNTGVFELMYNSGVSGSGFEMVYLDESPQESVGYDKIVNITNALLKLKELSTK